MDSPDLSARELILTLIDSATSASLPASYFVTAGRLFDMDPGGIRVALGRLVQDGSLVTPARGQYGLGSRGGQLQSLVRNWSQVETSLKPWRGAWLAVLTAHLKRTNKTVLRGRERALRLYGFAEAHNGLWIRPENLQTSLPELHAALVGLGLDADANAFVLTEPVQPPEPNALWDIRGLEAGYRQQLEALAQSKARLSELDNAAAARETLLLGRAVTRRILLDPLLPDELLDTSLRREMVSAMRQYDRLGKALWRNVYRSHLQGTAAPVA